MVSSGLPCHVIISFNAVLRNVLWLNTLNWAELNWQFCRSIYFGKVCKFSDFAWYNQCKFYTYLNVCFGKKTSNAVRTNPLPPAFTNILKWNNQRRSKDEWWAFSLNKRQRCIFARTVRVTVKISSVYTMSSPEGASPSKSYNTRT